MTLTQIIHDVTQLVLANECDDALARINQAQATQEIKSLCSRQSTILEVNLALQEIKRQRAALRLALEAMPESLRLQAEHLVTPAMNRLLDDAWADLKARKREWSRST